MTPERRVVLLALAELVFEARDRCDAALNAHDTILADGEEFTAADLIRAQEELGESAELLHEACAAFEAAAKADPT